VRLTRDVWAEHVSGAERKVLSLRVKPDFSDLCSPLRSHSRDLPLSSPLRPTWVLARSAPFPLTSCHKLSSKQWPIVEVRPTCCVVFVVYYGNCTCTALLFSIKSYWLPDLCKCIHVYIGLCAACRPMTLACYTMHCIIVQQLNLTLCILGVKAWNFAPICRKIILIELDMEPLKIICFCYI